MDALITVIIPVYNGEKYIESAINSLNKQVFRDFDVVFVDDGSGDASLEILKKLEEKQPDRIYVISQENQGVSAARNAGLKQAQGKYIAFVDVDDELDPHYLELLYQPIQGLEDCVAVSGQTKAPQEYKIEQVTTIQHGGVPLLEAFLYGQVATGVCGMLIPRKLLNANGLEFKSGYKYSEDLHMVWRVFNYARCAYFVDAPMYIYRDIEGSAMSKIDAGRLDSMHLIGELDPFFAEQRPDFYPVFHKFAVARMSWSRLWQSAHFLDYKAFCQFIKIYDFKSDIRKLITFPDKRVVLSSMCFLVSKRMYHYGISLATRKYRSA